MFPSNWKISQWMGILFLIIILFFIWGFFRNPQYQNEPSNLINSFIESPFTEPINRTTQKIRQIPQEDLNPNNLNPIDLTPEESSESEESSEEIPLPPPVSPKKKPVRPAGSRKEYLCREIMEKIYQVPFEKAYPDFLRNPETGGQLELDIYNDNLKIAVEYNGIQHYRWPNFTRQSKEAFIAQVRRDNYKIEQCDKNNVYLIVVPYTVPEHLLHNYIKNRLPD